MTEREFMVVVISWFLKRCFCIIKAFQLIRLACPVMHWWVELSQATTSALARPSWFRYNNRYQHQTTGCFKIIVFLFFYVKYSKGKKTLQCVWRHFSWIDRYLSIDLCVIYPFFYLSICLKCRHTIAIFSDPYCTTLTFLPRQADSWNDGSVV